MRTETSPEMRFVWSRSGCVGESMSAESAEKLTEVLRNVSRGLLMTRIGHARFRSVEGLRRKTCLLSYWRWR